MKKLGSIVAAAALGLVLGVACGGSSKAADESTMPANTATDPAGDLGAGDATDMGAGDMGGDMYGGDIYGGATYGGDPVEGGW
jgi:hypothetical protein